MPPSITKPDVPSLRIAVNAFATPVGGGRTYLARVLPRMVRLGARHRFTVFGTRGAEADLLGPDRVGATWRTVGFGAQDTKARILWENTVFPLALLRGRFDVVFCPANLSHFAGGVPRVIVLHNSLPFYPELWPFESAATQRRLRALAWVSHHFIARAHGSIFLSLTAAEDALRGTSITPRDQEIAYHGVDPDFGHAPHEAARREAGARFDAPAGYVFYASHLYRYKRFDSLIEAWRRLPEAARASRRLLLAGEPHDRDCARALQRQVEAGDFGGAIRFLGGMPSSELSLLHAGADAIAFLSVCESGSIGALEALASGRPVLLSNRSALPEIGADACLYADPDRPDEVAAQLTRLLLDAELAANLGRRARARAEQFTWDESARRALALLERVGATRRR